jgi:hypothetical protein
MYLNQVEDALASSLLGKRKMIVLAHTFSPSAVKSCAFFIPCSPLLLQIRFALDAKEYFIVDYPLLSQADHCIPLGLEGLSLSLLRGHRMIQTGLLLRFFCSVW